MKQHGELTIDHRASPGLSEDLARNLGMDPKLAGEGKLFEAATLTCSHCKVVVMKSPLRTRERGFCRKCMHYVCDNCALVSTLPDYTHAPYEKVAADKAKDDAKGLGSPRALLDPPKLIIP